MPIPWYAQRATSSERVKKRKSRALYQEVLAWSKNECFYKNRKRIVQYRIKIFWKHESLFYCFFYSEIYAPKIKSFKNLNVSNGDNAVIKCKVDSHPLAKVTWYKDGDLLTNVNRIDDEANCENRDEGTYFEMNSAKEFKLVICKSVWKMNSGTYSCQAQNSLGTIQKKSSVYVYGKKKFVKDWRKTISASLQHLIPRDNFFF